jgi:hypothetical protein
MKNKDKGMTVDKRIKRENEGKENCSDTPRIYEDP